MDVAPGASSGSNGGPFSPRAITNRSMRAPWRSPSEAARERTRIHAEAHGRPYLGVEVRQDQIADAAGQALWAERLSRIANEVASALR